MIIKSQDGKKLINMNTINGIVYDEIANPTQYRVLASFNGTWYRLGYYQSEERAKQILDKIIQAIELERASYTMPEE
jgi:peptide methionine sulfoxide reductase MsrA